jgi:subtilisin family serine protease
MPKCWLVLAFVPLLLCPGFARGQETSAQKSGASVPQLSDVEHTSILWLKNRSFLDATNSELAKRGIKITETFDDLDGAVVDMPAPDLQSILDQNPEGFTGIDYVEPNGIVTLFPSECVPFSKPSSELVPAGVKRVGGPIELGQGFAGRVWVVDSGIARDYDGNELNVDRNNAMECTASGCTSGPADDTFGHGTAVASIIGAKQNGDGLVGVAPGVTLLPIKVFETGQVEWPVIYRAMGHLLQKASPGDVVNISWGGEWDPSANGRPRRIEAQLRQLADKGVKIALAAGNYDALPASAYAQTVTPARAGAYRSQQADGVIMTVSAVDENDAFWPGSGFGNGEPATAGGFHLGPPDFAEPGVAIPVLWLKGEMRACTGTSFATPHLAGILVQGLPKQDGYATGDIDAAVPGSVPPQHEQDLGDPIGVRQ